MKTNGPVLIALVLVLVLTLCSARALAHDACCDHVHTDANDDFSNNTCAIAADCSSDWGGICMEKQLVQPGEDQPYYIFCSCLIPQGYNLVVAGMFEPEDGQTPQAFTSLSYFAVPSAADFAYLSFDDYDVVNVASGDGGVEAFVTLRYGSFDDPTRIPVTVEELFVGLPPGSFFGKPIGSSAVSLLPNDDSPLSFDIETGRFAWDGDSLPTELTTDLHGGTLLNLLFSAAPAGTEDADGMLRLQFQGATPSFGDSDGDGFTNVDDNCIDEPNPDQHDTDLDGIGNACDGDIATPNDCQVNFEDLGVIKAAFFSIPGDTAWNPDADLSGNGQINFTDLGLLKEGFFAPPGRSGLPNACQ